MEFERATTSVHPNVIGGCEVSPARCAMVRCLRGSLARDARVFATASKSTPARLASALLAILSNLVAPLSARRGANVASIVTTALPLTRGATNSSETWCVSANLSTRPAMVAKVRAEWRLDSAAIAAGAKHKAAQTVHEMSKTNDKEFSRESVSGKSPYFASTFRAHSTRMPPRPVGVRIVATCGPNRDTSTSSDGLTTCVNRGRPLAVKMTLSWAEDAPTVCTPVQISQSGEAVSDC